MKANPDSPQWPVRQRALEDGKRVYMAVPKLADDDPFFLLDPDRLEASPRDADTPVATTAHELQVLEVGTIPVTGHDVPLDLVVTPGRILRCDVSHDSPGSIHWRELTEEKIEAIPLLRRLRRERDGDDAD